MWTQCVPNVYFHYKACFSYEYTCSSLCTGELSSIHGELEQQMSRALQEKQALELKLTLAERNAQQTLITTQQSHQEQLLTERNRKVSLTFLAQLMCIWVWIFGLTVLFIIEFI